MSSLIGFVVGFVVGFLFGSFVIGGFWADSRWYWKSMYEVERDYSEKLKKLFEQNYPFKTTKQKGSK